MTGLYSATNSTMMLGSKIRRVPGAKRSVAQMRRSNRRGAIIIGVMVIITISMTMLVSWLRTAAAERRQIAQLERRAQASWLAESGLERAAARLAGDATYTGETWKPELTKSASSATGQVVIQVTTVAGQNDHRRVTARATLGSDPLTVAQRTKEATVRVQTRGE